jgi:hypothetical protein
VRERCLRRLARSAEADRVRDEMLAPPRRDPALGSKLLDLTEYYNASLYDGRSWHSDQHLRMLAETLRTRDAIAFDARGLVQLNSGTYPQTATAIERGRDLNAMHKKLYPASVNGIRVGLQAKALHFLLAAAHSGSAKAGTTVARIIVRYQDGGQAECPLVLGEDLDDWASMGYSTVAPDRVAWVGGRPLRMLFRKTWTNPAPDRAIASFDFLSTRREAAPFLAAATAE